MRELFTDNYCKSHRISHQNLYRFCSFSRACISPQTPHFSEVVWMQVLSWLLCLGLTEAFAVLPKEQVARHAVKLYRSKAQAHGHSWVTVNCKRLVGLLRQKNVAVNKLAAAATAVGKEQSLSEPEKNFQVAQMVPLFSFAKILISTSYKVFSFLGSQELFIGFKTVLCHHYSQGREIKAG